MVGSGMIRCGMMRGRVRMMRGRMRVMWVMGMMFFSMKFFGMNVWVMVGISI